MLPTAQGLGYQMLKVGDMGNESSLANAMSSCAQFGLRPAAAHRVIEEVCRCVDRWKERFRAAGVSPRDLEYLAQFIDRDGLRTQRHDFSKPKRAGVPRRPPAG